MKPKQTKLTHRQGEETTVHQDRQIQAETGKSYGTPEELLRFDAARVEPPGRVAQRLHESVANEPARLPWWKRILGRNE